MELYIEGQRVELFKDENVTLTSSVQNVKDISKVFTDYSTSFTVPGSDINNKIFKHWHKPEIQGGFDARTRKEATITLKHQPFKVGKIELNKATKKDGEIKSYNLTFFGNVVKLTDLFSDDLLTDLDLSAYAHDFSSDNVEDGLKGSFLLNGDVIYSLISSENKWEWGTGNDVDIKYTGSSTATQGLKWYELKPAIRLQRIVNAISIKYGLTFTDHFFNSDDFLKLYMWASRDKGQMKAFGEPWLMSFGGESYFTTDTEEPYFQTIFTLEITPEAGFENIPYSVVMNIDGVNTTFENEGTVTVQKITQQLFNETFSYTISSSQPFSFNASLNIVRFETLGTGDNVFSESTGVTSSEGFVNFTDTITDGVLQLGQLPKLKVVDFFTGLVKAFNLVVVPKDATSFTVQTLDEWYEQASVKDFTKYIDLKSEDIKRPKLNKEIKFNYTKSKTILNENFKDTNDLEYGDLEYETTYEGSNLDIKLPFENILFERISDNNSVVTDVRVATIIDKESKPVKTAPVIFYRNPINLNEDLGFRNEAGGLISLTNINDVGQENNIDNSTITNSLNWGAEISTRTLELMEQSLFSNYWEDYITQLYDDNRRIFTFTGYIPTVKLSLLQLNDKIVINNRRYLINSFNANLTTGKTTFQLLNDVKPLEVLPETNNGLEYELEFGLEG